MEIKLASARLIVPINFHEVASLSLLSKDGDISFVPEQNVVLAIRFKDKKKVIVPMSNISCMEPLDQKLADEHAAAKRAAMNAEAEKREAQAVASGAPVPVADVVRYEKVDGKIVETTGPKRR